MLHNIMKIYLIQPWDNTRCHGWCFWCQCWSFHAFCWQVPCGSNGGCGCFHHAMALGSHWFPAKKKRWYMIAKFRIWISPGTEWETYRISNCYLGFAFNLALKYWTNIYRRSVGKRKIERVCQKRDNFEPNYLKMLQPNWITCKSVSKHILRINIKFDLPNHE